MDETILVMTVSVNVTTFISMSFYYADLERIQLYLCETACHCQTYLLRDS